jgi:glycosyltransferase involved in cell wall biosynthesis
MASLTIDLYCRDGSPLKISPPMIYGRGVGGAELSMMTWAKEMAERGHQVRIYNNPDTAGDYEGVEYLPQDDFEPLAKRDVFIAYRSPPHKNIDQIKAGLKLHWSCDQFTFGNYATDIVPFVDKIICISPYHMMDYQARYNPPEDKLTYIDLGVRLQDYPLEIEKIQNRFIFCSVPERGLRIIRLIWPQIKEALPDATLVITADHRLWGSYSPNNQRYRLDLLGQDGIVFLGAIERHKLAKHQMQAQIHLHPAIYEELFCISSAECQAVGAYSMTPDTGALETTNEFGFILPGDPQDPAWQRDYTKAVIAQVLDQDTLTEKAAKGAKLARERFNWSRICDEWEEVISG